MLLPSLAKIAAVPDRPEQSWQNRSLPGYRVCRVLAARSWGKTLGEAGRPPPQSSPPRMRNITCPLAGVIIISTGSSWSPSKRLNSFKVRAGTITLISDSTGPTSTPCWTAKRNPSAAARLNLSPSSFNSTPVKTGLDSSVAAVNATRAMAAFSTCGSIWAARPSSTVGMGGNSLASVPCMVALERLQES